MKKYEKPDLVIERFELSHNIANCSAPLNHGETDQGCAVHDVNGVEFGYSVYTESVNCTYGPVVWEDYCKFTGTAEINVFTS